MFQKNFKNQKMNALIGFFTKKKVEIFKKEKYNIC
jgi:hypothetical protein